MLCLRDQSILLCEDAGGSCSLHYTIHLDGFLGFVIANWAVLQCMSGDACTFSHMHLSWVHTWKQKCWIVVWVYVLP